MSSFGRAFAVSGIAVSAVVIAATVTGNASVRQVNATQDRAQLVAGVNEIIAPGALPGGIAVWGKDAFPVLVAKDGKARLCLAAAAKYGRGRVVALSHGGFFGKEALARPDNAAFAKNLVSWVGTGKPSGNTLVVEGVADAFQPGSEAVETISRPQLVERVTRDKNALKGVRVLVLGQDALAGENADAAIKAVQEYVRDGGGLLIAGPAWGWMQMNPQKDVVRDHTGNRLLYPLGLAFTDGTADKTGREGWTTSAEGLETVHAGHALQVLTRYAGGDQTIAKDDLTAATQAIAATMAVLPDHDREFAPRVTELIKKNGGDTVPTRMTPITTAQPFARLAAVLYVRQWRRLPAEKITAHPASADFPGAVPANAPRVERKVTVNSAQPGWHSTGLYAAPGQVIKVSVSGPNAPRGWNIRIGSHTDRLWHLEKWERFPEISTTVPLRGGQFTVASPFGGSIYVEAPGGPARTVEVTIGNAVEAPLYVKGKTDLKAWRESIRNAPAPWAELVADKVAISVPASVVRTLDNPDALMTYWDEVMTRCFELYAAPARSRPERYCVDRQISAGYMHSGYPIMTGDDVAATFVNVDLLRSPTGKVWGFYHEMGHNFQEGEWTFGGTGEVTNNLFSLYGAEKINGIMAGAHPNMAPDKIKPRFDKYIENGAKFEEWKSDPFLALYMYVQVQKQFGWEPFTRVFAEYNALPESAQPKTDNDKHDQWMIRLSRATGHNLGPFFTAWGVPVSDKAKAEIASLPGWMPDELTQVKSGNR